LFDWTHKRAEQTWQRFNVAALPCRKLFFSRELVALINLAVTRIAGMRDETIVGLHAASLAMLCLITMGTHAWALLAPRQPYRACFVGCQAQ